MGLQFRRRRPTLTFATVWTSAPSAPSATPAAARPGYRGPDPVGELQRVADKHAAGEISDTELIDAKRKLMGI